MIAALVAAVPPVPASDQPALPTASPAEVRVVDYLKSHVEPGEPVVVSELYNSVFTQPAERAVLDRLFNAFFKIPLFMAQQQKASGRPPTLAQIAEQFRFAVPGETDLVLRIMESDPRVPRFFDRDPRTGEITRVDGDAILAHPRFGKALERTIAGWEGRPAPAFSAAGDGGPPVTSDALAGKPHLVYFWFTGCPPCMRTAPLLAELQKSLGPGGVVVAALNADRVLEVPASSEQRAAYARAHGWSFLRGEADAATLQAYGDVSVFPTFFFVDRRGVIVRQLVNYQPLEALLAAGRKALEPQPAR